MATKKKTGSRAPVLSAAEIDLTAKLTAAVAVGDRAAAKVIRGQLRELAFRRLAPKRVRKAIRAIRAVEKLSTYPADDADREKMLAALDAAITRARAAFERKAESAGAEFEL